MDSHIVISKGDSEKSSSKKKTKVLSFKNLSHSNKISLVLIIALLFIFPISLFALLSPKIPLFSGASSSYDPVTPPFIDYCNDIPGNFIKNYNFEKGKRHWRFSSAKNGRFGTIRSDYSCKRVASVKLNSNKSVQLYQNGFVLKPNTIYEVSFAAKASRLRNVYVILGNNEQPYVEYGKQQFALSDKWQEFTTTITTPANVDTNTRIRLWFGGKANDEFWFDNVVLREYVLLTPTPTPGLEGIGSALSLNNPILWQGQNYISVPASSSLEISPNVTIEAWYKSKPYQNDPTSHSGPLFVRMNSGTAYESLEFVGDNGGGDKLLYQHEISNLFATQSNTVSRNQWHHVATTFGENRARVFIDGILQGEIYLPESPVDISTLVNEIYIGSLGEGTKYFNGEIEELRVSNIVRYTNDFTPKMVPFSDDQYTMALYHFNGNLNDSSSFGNHGQAVGNVEYVDSVSISHTPTPTTTPFPTGPTSSPSVSPTRGPTSSPTPTPY